ncbi:hypothetical protein C1H46_024416 [Malus baccata]|uniref:Myb/SANT-like domain-containing protein n=1 Tax=Malus baccata TaxID=106549 RepID=A0A540LUP3_MALBA|nr:hypothetical protein C1H46_024416 [Malus baccata]
MSSNQDEDVASWPVTVEKHFIHLLHEERKKRLKGSTVDKNAWDAIEDELVIKFGKRYAREKLKAKYNRLRKIYREFAKLVAHTGMCWDPETDKVHASEEVWESYLKKNKFASRFRRKGCPQYQVLGEIFNHIPSNGQMHSGSIASPPNSDVERGLESEFPSSGARSSPDTEGGIDTKNKGDEGNSKTQKRRPLSPPGYCRTRKESRTSKAAKLGDGVEVWTVSPDAETESSLPKVEYRKKNDFSSPFRELASIEDCMEVLESMEDLDDAAYVRACERFTSSDWRRMFMKMSDARKRMWLYSLK